ncbi:MAG: class I SAM-dependent methyltransferase [Proteobacteria bacterium]|nr:class I SAM-dependent methyltransferase [Pseudomonadota bacterium]
MAHPDPYTDDIQADERPGEVPKDDPHGHWEGMYATKAEDTLSWYQRHSSRSLAYVTAAASWASPIIDIGGGSSTLVDDLLARGYANITVLDIAEAGLAKTKARLGAQASRVNWIVADIRHWHPPRLYEVWHDRAMFHFLTSAEDQAAYLAALRAGTTPEATVILATFAPDGPEQCSGLPIQRYSPQTLASLLGPSFRLVEETAETHTTPSGIEQRFSYAVFRRDPTA